VETSMLFYISSIMCAALQNSGNVLPGYLCIFQYTL
jgi:hypothetical protein